MKAVLLAIFLGGCAHYSLATNTSTISVPTFSIEASTDLNGAELAKTMVSRLEHFGLKARFGTNVETANLNQLACHVLSDQIINGTGTEGVGFSRVKIICENRGKEFTQILTAGANMGDALDNRRVLVQSAATEGVETLAVKISKHFISVQEQER